MPGAPAASVTLTPVFRRGDSEVHDAYIDSSDPGKNYGGDNLVLKQGGSTRVLLWFDLRSIPADATIDAAELRIMPWYQSPAGCSLVVSAYALRKSWEESTVTYNSPWSLPGASGTDDRESAVASAATISAMNNWVRFPLRTLVQEWVSGVRENHGLILIAGPGGCYISIRSSEASSSRPELAVTYHVETPSGPTATPTLTGTPIPGASPTPRPSVIVSTIVESCLKLVPSPTPKPLTASGEVLLVWEGTPASAKLKLRYSNNRVTTHPIYLNGHLVGTLPGKDYVSMCTGGTDGEWPLDLAWLAQGRNVVTISNEDDPGDNWGAQYVRIELTGDLRAPEARAITYTTGRTYSPQTGWMQLPIAYQDDRTRPRPLLVACHWWGATGQDVLMDYAAEANRRGWFLVCPDMANLALGSFHYTPSLDVQRDIIDAVEYMKSHYPVDARRIYLVGKSMGGGFAATVAAKYPDVFAAVVDHQGPTRWDQWYYESNAERQAKLYGDVGVDPLRNPFAYQQRSAFYMARNLRHVPLAITYPLNDTVVPPHHSTDLYQEALKWGADPSHLAIYPFPGVHGDDPPTFGIAAFV